MQICQRQKQPRLVVSSVYVDIISHNFHENDITKLQYLSQFKKYNPFKGVFPNIILKAT